MSLFFHPHVVAHGNMCEFQMECLGSAGLEEEMFAG
jgi:hypothetical protein